ncbi:MAG: ATP-binding cassette domain-containing protein [Chloroflexi bacterium]|nr:ATP-binding cassette domain-containing protein [Chloroflexota bacterium]
MIEVSNLTKYYGDFTAIEDLNFHVEKGEVLGFLGPNGAGKTTTMRILTGFMPPSDGTVKIAGYDVFSQSLEARRHVGYLPETVPLYPEMTVYAYLDFVAKLRGVDDREDHVWDVMDTCWIEDRADQLIGQLSKGYRQRVGLAQALIHNPDVLVLDEPTIGLDPKQIIEVRGLIKELGKEHTVILSTHILPEVSQICNRVIIINKGHLVAVDSPERLSARAEGAERVLLKLQQPAEETPALLGNIGGVTSVEPAGDNGFEITCDSATDCRPEIAAAAVQNGWGLLEMRALGASLEDVFLQLTAEEDTNEDEDEDAA